MNASTCTTKSQDEMVPEISPPAIARDLKRVSQDEFFARIRSPNINPHPRIKGKYHEQTGYTSEWLNLDSPYQLVGVSDGGTHLCPNRFWLV